jgi:hypothetical protein
MIMMITTELPILNVSTYIYFAKSQMTFDEIGNLEDDETEVYQSASDEIWVSYRSDETGIHYSAVYKKSKNNYWNITELTSREYIDESDYYE